jgi:murein DD-endopeptidase MepM/ murein hydrolase activator NlpD
MMKPTILIYCSILFVVAGCSPKVLPTVMEEPRSRPAPTFTPIPSTATFVLIGTQTPTILPTKDPVTLFNVSSPLEDIQLVDLKSIISEPFFQTGPELDDGHHGTDFAFYDFGSLTTIIGLPIHSVLNGKVAGVINKKKPYGNLIIIETRMDTFPIEFLKLLSPPIQETPFPYNPRLQFCTSLKGDTWSVKPESIYLLYGHMLEPSPLQVGDMVTSGQTIGKVGNTGMSGNAHLHLEMRWGPGGTEFASMNYYDTAATPEENINYCIWRISGKFVRIDPMSFFNAWDTLH